MISRQRVSLIVYHRLRCRCNMKSKYAQTLMSAEISIHFFYKRAHKLTCTNAAVSAISAAAADTSHGSVVGPVPSWWSLHADTVPGTASRRSTWSRYDTNSLQRDLYVWIHVFQMRQVSVLQNKCNGLPSCFHSDTGCDFDKSYIMQNRKTVTVYLKSILPFSFCTAMANSYFNHTT